MTLIEDPSQTEKDTSSASYDPLAPHYEAFVGEDRYPDWLAALLRLAAENGVAGGRALDVGCGTGLSLAALLGAGFVADGCDPSAAMLREARALLGPEIPLEVARLPHLPDRAAVDLVTALNDVVNYVAPDDLDAAVGALAARVRRGGLVLFDANTSRTLRQLLRLDVLPFRRRALLRRESLPSSRPQRSLTERTSTHSYVTATDRIAGSAA